MIQSVDGALSCEFTRAVKGSFTYYGYGPVEKEVDYSDSMQDPKYYLYLSHGIPYPGLFVENCNIFQSYINVTI